MSTLFIAIPLTLFVLFVLPVWLWLHYNNRTASGSLSQNEQQRLLQLSDAAKDRLALPYRDQRTDRASGAVARQVEIRGHARR